MNGGRVLLGGLVAGVLVLASGVLLGHGVLGEEYVRAFASHRAAPAGAGVIAKNTAIRLGLGFVAIFLYAAMRPRFGPGPRTALIAAVTVWLIAYLPYTATLVDFGILTGWRTPVSLAWTLAEISIGTLAGAAIYRERAGADGDLR